MTKFQPTGWHALLYKETLRFWKVGFQTVGAAGRPVALLPR